jgi:hypothetical protein
VEDVEDMVHSLFVEVKGFEDEGIDRMVFAIAHKSE